MQHERISAHKDLTLFRAVIVLALMLLAMSFASCGKAEPAPIPGGNGVSTDGTPEIEELRATDLAVFLSYDDRADTMRLMSVDNGRKYTVSVNQLTSYADNYGKVSVPELFEPGMLVKADISVHSRLLRSLSRAPEAFEKRDVTGFDMNMNRGVFALSDGTNLRITENTAVIKDGETVKAKDVTDGDSLIIRGVDHDLYSIVITSGCGHLRIKGAEYFVGGWVQIGGTFKPVSDDMLLDLPEGEYDMTVTYKGRGGTKHVVLQRGKETEVDVTDLKGDLIKTGQLVFTIRPADAMPVVKIDGKKVDHLDMVELEYGVYMLEIEAEGYKSVKERISVGSDISNIEVELEASTADTTDTKPRGTSENILRKDADGIGTMSDSSSTGLSGSSSGSSSTSSSSSSSLGSGSINYGNRIYIDEPEGAEVYFDGIYKGIVPCSFVKETGTHVIALRKDGYETRTFTVTLDTSTENETYSFSALQQSQ